MAFAGKFRKPLGQLQTPWWCLSLTDHISNDGWRNPREGNDDHLTKSFKNREILELKDFIDFLSLFESDMWRSFHMLHPTCGAIVSWENMVVLRRKATVTSYEPFAKNPRNRWYTGSKIYFPRSLHICYLPNPFNLKNLRLKAFLLFSPRRPYPTPQRVTAQVFF